MKVAITGHTKGIGKALADVFPDHVGFSRSTGYDISERSSRLDIVKDSIDCDIFINNATSGFGQAELLFDIWEQWKTKPDKIIVNIGSVASDYSHSDYRLYIYATQKTALEYASTQMSMCKSPCKVVLIKPGYVVTEAMKAPSAKKMMAEDLASQIKELVTMKTSFWVSSMTLYPL
jgi:NAD(P)-dependent dehydrogenase (short-subunit alcohol dehydrogenase family)